VVAGNAENRCAERAEQAAKMRVAGRVVLHDVAGDEQRVYRPVAAPREGERALERRHGLHATQGTRFAAVKMRIGKLYETQHA
jgi:hypothetical protein